MLASVQPLSQYLSFVVWVSEKSYTRIYIMYHPNQLVPIINLCLRISVNVWLGREYELVRNERITTYN